jgi:hypothetical protein
VPISIQGVYGIPNALTSDDCAVITSQYNNWLNANGYKLPGIHAYQLYTARELVLNGDKGCLGMGQSDSIWASDPVSVLEGYDNRPCCDWYDPDSTYQRGVVSGQEMAHVYGSDGHSPCSRCDIMGGGPCWERGYYFSSQSKNDIYWRYHYNLEWT